MQESLHFIGIRTILHEYRTEQNRNKLVGILQSQNDSCLPLDGLLCLRGLRRCLM